MPQVAKIYVAFMLWATAEYAVGAITGDPPNARFMPGPPPVLFAALISASMVSLILYYRRW
jgi:hypothetical protein